MPSVIVPDAEDRERKNIFPLDDGDKIIILTYDRQTKVTVMLLDNGEGYVRIESPGKIPRSYPVVVK